MKNAVDGLGMGLANDIRFVSDPFGLSNKAYGLSWVQHNSLLSILPTNCSQTYKNFYFICYLRATVPNKNLMFLSVLLMLSGDVCMNPGPGTQSYCNASELNDSSFPCLLCKESVNWSADALQCDGCDNWLHRECIRMSNDEYERLAGLTATWLCCHCGLMNISTDLFIKSTLNLENKFNELSDSSSEFPSLDAATWVPIQSSSPNQNLCKKAKGGKISKEEINYNPKC